MTIDTADVYRVFGSPTCDAIVYLAACGLDSVEGDVRRAQSTVQQIVEALVPGRTPELAVALEADPLFNEGLKIIRQAVANLIQGREWPTAEASD